jgi:predicted nucleic acid-binding protein
MVIVDSTVWIDLLGGRQNAETVWLKREIPERPIGLIDLILCEVLQGVRTDAVFGKVKGDLTDFEVFDSGGIELAVAAAENYRILRSNGIMIRKTIDCLIATFCIEEGHALLHHDRDFEPFERYLGLQVIHPPLHS